MSFTIAKASTIIKSRAPCSAFNISEALSFLSIFKGSDESFSSLVLTSGGKLIDDLEKANIEVIKLKIDKKNPYSIIKNFFLFIKIFREKKINLVHVRSRAPAWSAIFAAKKSNISLEKILSVIPKIKPVEGWLFGADRDAVFGLYYSPTENDDVGFGSDHTEIIFPLDTPPTASTGGGLGDFATPGFTWIIGIGGLAMAAIIIPKSINDE